MNAWRKPTQKWNSIFWILNHVWRRRKDMRRKEREKKGKERKGKPTKMHTGHLYEDNVNQKAFFDSFALSNGFDPLIANSWYSITYRKMQKTKVPIPVSFHHINTNTISRDSMLFWNRMENTELYQSVCFKHIPILVWREVFSIKLKNNNTSPKLCYFSLSPYILDHKKKYIVASMVGSTLFIL